MKQYPPTNEIEEPRDEEEATTADDSPDLQRWAAFRRDMDALRARTVRELGPADSAHLRKIARWGRMFALVGYATAWIVPNPISVFCIAAASSIRIAVMHHVLHGAYARLPDLPAGWARNGFAKGWRRFVDWFDWIEPEAWRVEHNLQHHLHTNDPADPDLVARNFTWVREWRLPRPLKIAAVLLAASLWKPFYYAPNALNGLEARHSRGAPHEYVISLQNFWDLRIPLVRHYWARSFAPYFLVHFVVLPLCLLPIGAWASIAFLINRALAELLTNLHTFLVIVPSHAAEDLHCFEGPPRDRDEVYARQVMGTANYPAGGDVHDLFHIFINYQVEHHLFPDLPMSAYQRIHADVVASCAKHGIPYVEEPLTARIAKLFDVAVGPTEPRLVASARAIPPKQPAPVIASAPTPPLVAPEPVLEPEI